MTLLGKRFLDESPFLVNERIAATSGADPWRGIP